MGQENNVKIHRYLSKLDDYIDAKINVSEAMFSNSTHNMEPMFKMLLDSKKALKESLEGLMDTNQ